MSERLLSKCLNFQRIIQDRSEIQVCKGTGKQVFCGSWSDRCTNRPYFKSSEGLQINQIEFNKLPKPGYEYGEIHGGRDLGDN